MLFLLVAFTFFGTALVLVLVSINPPDEQAGKEET